MYKLTLRPRDDNPEGKALEIENGNYILIESNRRNSGGLIFGVFRSTANFGRSIFLEDGAVKFYLSTVFDEIFPTLERLRDQDCKRSTAAILDITVGKDEIADRLMAIDSSYECYARKIQRLGGDQYR